MRRISFIFAMMALFVSLAKADQVLLKNGDRLTGTIVHLDSNNLLVKTDALGNVKVQWDAVAKITADAPLHVNADGAQVEAGAIERSPKGETITTTGDTAFLIAPGRILSLVSQTEHIAAEQKSARGEHREALAIWNGTLDAGVSGARGNSDTTNMSMGLRGARVTGRDRFSIYVNSLLASNRASGATEATTSANTIRSGLRYDMNVSDHVFTFAFTTLETDHVQHLNMRNVFGGGAGYRLAQSQSTTLDVFSGASLNRENYSYGAPDRSTGEMLVGQDLQYHLNDRTSIGGRMSLFPNLSTPGEYRAVIDTTATTKFTKWIGWQVTVSNTYVTNPPLGTRNNDLLVSTGIRLSLGSERPFKAHSKVLRSDDPRVTGYQ